MLDSATSGYAATRRARWGVPVLCLSLLLLSQAVHAGSPRRAEHYLRKGIAAMEAEELGKAEDLFLRARRADPLLPQPEIMLGHLAMIRTEFDEAENAFLRAIELYRSLKSSLLRQNREMLWEARDRLEPLKTALQNSENDNTGDGVAASRHLQRQAEVRRKEQSLQHAELDEEEIRVPGELFLLLGNARVRAGRAELAVETYREAINRLPNTPEPHHNLAVALAQSRKLAEALEECTKADRMGYPPSADLRSRLEAMLTDPPQVDDLVEEINSPD